MNTPLRYLAIAIVGLGLVACGKKETPPPPAPAPAPAPAPTPPAPAVVAVSSATLGTAVGADKSISAATESFAKKDTIYVSVATTGTGTATLKARWTYTTGGKSVSVKEDTQTIQATGPAVTEFHISKPDGWPAGDYQVEVLLNDQVVQTKKFSVK